MMVAQTKAWKEVNARFEALGEHLHSRFEEAGADVGTEREAFEESLRHALSALEEAFGSASKVVRDPVLRSDLNALATAVRSALTATVDRAGEQVRNLTTPVRRALPKGKKAVVRAAKPTVKKPAVTKPAAKAAHKPVVGKPATRKRTKV